MVAIVGPTCTGKTALSLALAERLETEIVACDSRTIYRDMDIGTAKPSAEEQERTRHHMLDVASPSDVYTVARYKEEGRQAIEAILERGRLPLVVGGTGFYARALLEGLEIPRVEPQPELRESLRELARKEGAQALHQRLQEKDPAAAARIGVNDVLRMVRALEVTEVAGKPFSELAAVSEPPYDTVWIGLTVGDRSRLHESIARRFHEQMRAGMLAETERLLAKYGPCRTLLNTVNYRELVQYLQGQIDLKAAAEGSIKHNRQLARRQLIWFRANPQVTWFEVDRTGAAQLVDAVLAKVSTTC